MIVAHWVLAPLLGAFLLPAHDSWIAEGGLRNPAGEWCCGKMDCGILSKDAVTPVEGGYSVNGWMYVEAAKKSYPVHEFVPNSEAQPSPDGAFWRCAIALEGDTPGGLRRCFFFPPPNT
jgi:hypothetical protein